MARVLTPWRNTWLQVINHDIEGGFLWLDGLAGNNMELKQQVMVEHLQSGDHTMAPEDSPW